MIFNMPTSPGEVLDRFLILSLKASHTGNRNQPHFQKFEKVYKHVLETYESQSVLMNEIDQLRHIHAELWNLEDQLRTDEDLTDFQVATLSRTVRSLNDQRAQHKKNINKLLDSDFEDKTYGKVSGT